MNEMNNEEAFKIRAYGFGELAQLYFPNLTKRSASNQLRRWILGSEKLLKALLDSGYKSGKKILTPINVKIIIIEFGPPN